MAQNCWINKLKNRLIKNFEVFFQKQSHFKDHLKIIGGKKEKRDL